MFGNLSSLRKLYGTNLVVMNKEYDESEKIYFKNKHLKRWKDVGVELK